MSGAMSLICAAIAIACCIAGPAFAQNAPPERAPAPGNSAAPMNGGPVDTGVVVPFSAEATRGLDAPQRQEILPPSSDPQIGEAQPLVPETYPRLVHPYENSTPPERDRPRGTDPSIPPMGP